MNSNDERMRLLIDIFVVDALGFLVQETNKSTPLTNALNGQAHSYKKYLQNKIGNLVKEVDTLDQLELPINLDKSEISEMARRGYESAIPKDNKGITILSTVDDPTGRESRSTIIPGNKISEGFGNLEEIKAKAKGDSAPRDMLDEDGTLDSLVDKNDPMLEKSKPSPKINLHNKKGVDNGSVKEK